LGLGLGLGSGSGQGQAITPGRAFQSRVRAPAGARVRALHGAYTSVPFLHFLSSWPAATSTSASSRSICSPTAAGEAMQPPSAASNCPRLLTCSWASRYMASSRGSQSSPASSGCCTRFMCSTRTSCLWPPRQKEERDRTLAPTRAKDSDLSSARLPQ
jgi:hypothetical protein